MEDEMSDSDLSATFDRAANYIRSIAGQLDGAKLLYFYARFKQSNEGPCNTPKPGFFDFQGKQKWDAWKKLGKKSKTDAMKEYITELSNHDPNWENKNPQTSGRSIGGGLGVGVSVMCPPEENAVRDEDKTIFDWCVDGNITEVQRVLTAGKHPVDQKDGEGLALLHWACDRGYQEMVEVLLNNNADINIQDSEGQTPLHYAVSCEHPEVIKVLLKHGASRSTKDLEGVSPEETTTNEDILELFKTTG